MKTKRHTAYPFQVLGHRALLAAMLLAAISSAYAQREFAYSEDAEKRFSSGLRQYESADYESAAASFEELLSETPVHQRTTAAWIMAAKTQFQMRQYAKALSLTQKFLERFPESDYADDAHYTGALALMMLKRYREGELALLAVTDSSPDERLAARADTLIGFVSDQWLTAEVLRELLSKVREQRSKDILTVSLAEKLYLAGDPGGARDVLKPLLGRRVPGRELERARRLQEEIGAGISLKIAVLLPLLRDVSGTSDVNPVAGEILEGINTALDEFNASPPAGLQVKLYVRDTERDPSRARKIMAEVADEHDVIAVIGPLFSSAVMDCAPVANEKRMPMLTPTANAVGLAGASPSVFQLNPDLMLRGRAVARYAVRTLGFTVLATVAETSLAVQQQVEGFVSEATRLGATVLAGVTYDRGASDLQPQFMALRRAAAHGEPQITFGAKLPRVELARILRAGAKWDLVDSLMKTGGSTGVTRLFGASGRKIADSLKLKVSYPDVDPENIEQPVTTIQGVFAPVADPGDIGIISSQMAYDNIKTQLLGNGEWNDLTQLDAERRYVNGVVFWSETFVDRDDSVYQAFEKAFRNRMRKLPSRYTLFGYDCMKLVLGCLSGGATTREGLARALSRVKGYRGLHSTISLDHGRVNNILHILRYRNGGISRIEELTIY